LEELLGEGGVECAVDLGVAVLPEVVQGGGPVLEGRPAEQGGVRQEEQVHFALDLIIAYVSQCFRLNDGADNHIVLVDFLFSSELLISQEIPFKQMQKRALRGLRELTMISTIEIFNHATVIAQDLQRNLEVEIGFGLL